MITQAHPYRTVFLSQKTEDDNHVPAVRLLNDLGHDVHDASSISSAVGMIASEQTDLVIIDAEQVSEDFVAEIRNLPIHAMPRRMLVVSDDMKSANAARRRLSPLPVEVLVRPLQVYGLLKAIRKIEGQIQH